MEEKVDKHNVELCVCSVDDEKFSRVCEDEV